MKLCRFKTLRGRICVGLVQHEAISDLGGVGINELTELWESDSLLSRLRAIGDSTLPHYGLNDVQLLPPVERQEVWAAGVTYERSKSARMDESDFSATAYDRVYSADRPELFFKSPAEKVVPSGEAVGIRRDAAWSVPEPELALMLNSQGAIVGYTIGNDMSSRDIEGANLLYLPQAKIYDRSCALGPFVRVGATEAEVRAWTIELQILRNGAVAFAGQASIAQIRRSFEDLVAYLFRSQAFPQGAVLLTGTGVVPPETFTLQPQDLVEIRIPEIGVLRNPVVTV